MGTGRDEAFRGAPPPGRLSGVTHLVWDWNGTLFDDAWLCVEVMNGLLRRRGLPELDADRYRRLFDFPVRRYYGRLGFDFDREPFEKVGSEFMAAYERRRLSCGLRPGARAVLARVRGLGIGQSVLSGYRHDTLRGLLDHFGLLPFFEAVFGSDDHYAEGKEAQARRWLEGVRADRSRTVLVGDTAHDGEIARQLGVACWLLPGGHHDRARLEACGVPVLDSLEAILAE